VYFRANNKAFKRTMVKNGAVLLLFLLAFGLPLSAQSYDSIVEWSYQAEAVGESEYELQFTADIQKGWYLYSQHVGDAGPIPTRVQMYDHPLVELLEEVQESGEAVEGMDEMFGIEIKKFKNKAVFTQRIRVEEGLKEINGFIEFMCCNEEKCLPPREIPFTLSFRG